MYMYLTLAYVFTNFKSRNNYKLECERIIILELKFLNANFFFQRENAEGEGSEGNEPDDEDNEGMENLIKNKMNSTVVIKLHCHNIPNSAAS